MDKGNAIFEKKTNYRAAFNCILRRITKNERIEADHLKFTAGRYYYEKGIPVELIQKTLRLKRMNDMEYCYPKSFDEVYTKVMNRFNSPPQEGGDSHSFFV